MQTITHKPICKNQKESLVLLLGQLLFADGLYFVLQLRFNFGALLPLLIGLGLIIYALAYPKLIAYIQTTTIRQSIWRWAWAIFFVWVFSLVIFFVFFIKSTKYPSCRCTRYCSSWESSDERGKPSPSIGKPFRSSGKLCQTPSNSIMVIMGGLSFQQKNSEAEAMRQYLIDVHHIPAQRIYTRRSKIQY